MLPNTAFALALPRRSRLSSTTSSCSNVAVWINSTHAASSTGSMAHGRRGIVTETSDDPSGPGDPLAAASWGAATGAPQRRAAASVSIGRSRLPPAATTWAAKRGISAIVLVMRATMARSHASRSSHSNLESAVRASSPPRLMVGTPGSMTRSDRTEAFISGPGESVKSCCQIIPAECHVMVDTSADRRSFSSRDACQTR